MRKSSPTHIGSLVTPAIERILPPAGSAAKRRNPSSENPACPDGPHRGSAHPSHAAGRRLRTSRAALDEWLFSETRAKTMALAAELGWQVPRVLALAVDLLLITSRNKAVLHETLKNMKGGR